MCITLYDFYCIWIAGVDRSIVRYSCRYFNASSRGNCKRKLSFLSLLNATLLHLKSVWWTAILFLTSFNFSIFFLATLDQRLRPKLGWIESVCALECCYFRLRHIRHLLIAGWFNRPTRIDRYEIILKYASSKCARVRVLNLNINLYFLLLQLYTKHAINLIEMLKTDYHHLHHPLSCRRLRMLTSVIVFYSVSFFCSFVCSISLDNGECRSLEISFKKRIWRDRRPWKIYLYFQSTIHYVTIVS